MPVTQITSKYDKEQTFVKNIILQSFTITTEVICLPEGNVRKYVDAMYM